MADVKICDRCGKTIKATKIQRVGFGAWRYSLFTPGMSNKYNSNWDLCVDCGNRLSKFLNGWDPDERPDDALIYAR